MKITKRIREEAALICAMWASSEGMAMSEALGAIGIDWMSDARLLADKAYDYAGAGHPNLPSDGSEYEWRERFAEAESLLRTGWSPE